VRIILASLIIVLILVFLGCWDVLVHTRPAAVRNEVQFAKVVQATVEVGDGARGAAGRGGNGLGRLFVAHAPDGG